MITLRTRLIAAFLAATILPVILTLWITTSLLERSLNLATTDRLDELSKSLEETGREYYRAVRESLQRDADAGIVEHETFPMANRPAWPPAVVEFWENGEAERFAISGTAGNQLDYFVRHDDAVWLYQRPLANVRMEKLTDQYRAARGLVEQAAERDLRRGFTTTLIVLVVSVWIVAFLWLIYIANRVSRPIQQLTLGLSKLAAGDLQTRMPDGRNDEIGRAIDAFNHTAAELQQSRDRLVYLTQIASWQAMARKMAHELKNSLTPIRLTVEEILHRQPAADREFMQQAVQIVVSEVETLERRVRAFSEFSSEPGVRLASIDIRALLDERIAFLKPGHATVTYRLDSEKSVLPVRADPDRVRGILTNLLENAADAAGNNGVVLGRCYSLDTTVHIEIHDSGPGLRAEARRTLFEPTITFKERGMGLGLSIARKDALLCGGDLMLIDGQLGGAGFRLVLPAADGVIP